MESEIFVENCDETWTSWTSIDSDFNAEENTEENSEEVADEFLVEVDENIMELDKLFN